MFSHHSVPPFVVLVGLVAAVLTFVFRKLIREFFNPADANNANNSECRQPLMARQPSIQLGSRSSLIANSIQFLVGSTNSSTRNSVWCLNDDGSFQFMKTISLGGVASECGTWMCQSLCRKFLYSLNENSHLLSSFRVVRNSPNSVDLVPLSTVSTGGISPTHVALGSDSVYPTLFVANYSSGEVSVVGIQENQQLTTPTQIINENPPRRTDIAHAHQCVVERYQDGTVLHVCDLGMDTVYTYNIAPASLTPLTLKGTWVLPAGSGPRHLVLSHPAQQPRRYAYLVCELNCTVCAVPIDPTTHNLTGKVVFLSTLPAGQRVDGMGTAEILLSADGRFLYISNRDTDMSQQDRSSIAVFSVSRDGASLQMIQCVSSGGRHPRGMCLVTDHTATNQSAGRVRLLVANRDAQNFACFPVNTSTGLLDHAAAVLSPSNAQCVDPAFFLQM